MISDSDNMLNVLYFYISLKIFLFISSLQAFGVHLVLTRSDTLLCIQLPLKAMFREYNRMPGMEPV